MLAQSINVAFAVGLAFAIAASCNFPVLLMSMFWKDMTTRGAVVGGFLGLITAFLGVVLSPAVWEGIFGNPKGSALVTIDNPTLFSMTLAFVAIYVVSKVDSSSSALRRIAPALWRSSYGLRRASAPKARPRTDDEVQGAIRASGFGRAPFFYALRLATRFAAPQEFLNRPGAP